MTATELHTALLPREERLAAWRRHLARALAPVDVRTPYETDFTATLRLVDLGILRIATMTSPPLEASRRARRQDGGAHRTAGHYALVLNRSGDIEVDDGHGGVHLAPGELTFCDASRPFTVRMTGPDRAPQAGAAALTALVPRKLIPVRAEGPEPQLLARFRSDEAMVSMLTRHLHDVVRHAGRWRAADRSRLAVVTVDLMAALLTRAPGAAEPAVQEPGRLALQNRIHAYVQGRLGDPGLGPRQVADAHRISVRHLHQLFREQGLTIAAWIRRSRLERCCRDLADPGQAETAIHTIAARWGFQDAAHFSRVFRTTYGIPPSEYRRTHMTHAYPRGAHATSTTS
ncbi:helix-turn-helix domain-containing protein [Streptomyces sp. NPDC002680]|uniref:helix-turn-helix domain-containing protein n=1 Tax=Streptomyces sp. NPDC002680 TaxID=3364659 RepID=UPI0036C08F9B